LTLNDGLNWDEIDPLIAGSLKEDLGDGDVTTDGIVPAGVSGIGRVFSKQDGVVAGLPVFFRVFEIMDSGVRCESGVPEGSVVKAGAELGTVRGEVRSLLKAERTALNFLQRLSGIATLTRAYVDSVKGTGARILDTRKTTPTLRALEKYAVRMGGGENHRFGLFDMALIKNNHIDAAGGVSTAVDRCLTFIRREGRQVKVEVEARTLSEVETALRHPVQRILLDNMDAEDMKDAVRIISGRTEIEASGGIRLDNVRSIAESGVDFISVGALTHSAAALDISFRIEVVSRNG
jgi:nicotinate-nucleotide pyrophosphorylase (carboxylating)